MTAAPKSDRITAAPGPAMKLARSTTFSPEKMLSLAIGSLLNRCAWRVASLPAELRRSLLEEGGRALLLVIGAGAEAEVGRFEQKALALARFQSFVHCFKREFDSDRSVGSDLVQDRFGACDEIGRRNDLVDKPDTMGLLRADHLSGQYELERPALADQPRQPLRSAAARKQSERDLRLAELRTVHRDPDGARHRGLAAAAERKAVDGRDHRLAEILDEIEHRLAEAARPFCVDRSRMRELANVGTGDEGFVAGSSQDDATHGRVVACVLESGPQVLPRRCIQSVEQLRPVDRHVRDP